VAPEEVDPGPVHPRLWFGAIWYRQVWQFSITPDNQSVIVNEMDAPGSGWLKRCALMEDGRGVRLDVSEGRQERNRVIETWRDVVSDAGCLAAAVLALLAALALLRWIGALWRS